VEDGVVLSKNFWLAISHSHIGLYSPSKKVKFMEEGYEVIANVQSNPNAIKFEIRASTLKLRTNQSYMIHSLIRQYQSL
jgi:hypothetical protein